MKIERALQIRDMLKRNIYDIYSSAKNFKLSSDQINDRKNKLKRNIPTGTPSWVLSYVEGMEEVLRQDLYNNHLEFCYKINEILYSTSRNSLDRKSSRYYEDYGIAPSDLQKLSTSNGHYWINSDKPFFFFF